MKTILALNPQLLVLEAITCNQWVITISEMLRATSMELYRHSVTVASITAHMAVFGNRQILEDNGIEPLSLVIGAYLHDIGYIGKGGSTAYGKQPSAMSYIEQYAYTGHMDAGLAQAKLHMDDKVILDIIAMHHEYMDGSGYPKGLRGEEIPVHVRVVSIANAICAYFENTDFSAFESTKQLIDELLDYLNNEAISRKYDISLLAAFMDGIMRYYDTLIPLRDALHDYCLGKMQETKSR